MDAEKSLEKTETSDPENNYTIFHAFVEALRNKERDKKRSKSILHRLKIRK